MSCRKETIEPGSTKVNFEIESEFGFKKRFKSMSYVLIFSVTNSQKKKQLKIYVGVQQGVFRGTKHSILYRGLVGTPRNFEKLTF